MGVEKGKSSDLFLRISIGLELLFQTSLPESSWGEEKDDVFTHQMRTKETSLEDERKRQLKFKTLSQNHKRMNTNFYMFHTSHDLGFYVSHESWPSILHTIILTQSKPLSLRVLCCLFLWDLFIICLRTFHIHHRNKLVLQLLLCHFLMICLCVTFVYFWGLLCFCLLYQLYSRVQDLESMLCKQIRLQSVEGVLRAASQPVYNWVLKLGSSLWSCQAQAWPLRKMSSLALGPILLIGDA